MSRLFSFILYRYHTLLLVLTPIHPIGIIGKTMSKTSFHLHEVTQLIGKILQLVQDCQALEVATRNDKLFITYCDDTHMSPQYKAGSAALQ